MAGKGEIVATVTQVNFRADSGFTTLVADSHQGTCGFVGVDEGAELTPGLTYLFWGKWATHRQYGLQFKFETFVERQPSTPAGIATYLAIHCPGIGQARAKALVDHYGELALEKVRARDTGLLAPGLGTGNEALGHLDEHLLHAAAEALLRLQEHERTLVEITNLLHGRGFRRKAIALAIQEWGVRAPSIIRRNPFVLMLKQWEGCTFKKCDDLYLHLKLPPNRLRRQLLAGYDFLLRNDEDTWVPTADFLRAVREAVPAAKPSRALELGVRSGILRVERDEFGKQLVAAGSRWQEETEIALLVNDLFYQRQYPQALWYDSTPQERRATHCRFCRRPLSDERSQRFGYGPQCGKRHGLFYDTVELDQPTPLSAPWLAAIPGITDHQQAALAKATTGHIGVLMGRPGVGKTHCLSAAIAHLGPSARPLAIAPTGKAAVRIRELISSKAPWCPTRTIHSAIAFAHAQKSDLLPFRHIFIDEASMVSTSLLAEFLAVVAEGTKLLFVGDIRQLPPIGHGAPLRDLLHGGIPTGFLTEIHRNEGRIVRACHDMADRQPILFAPTYRPPNDNFINLRFRAGEEHARLQGLLQQLASDGFDPVRDVQVICALNDKGACSRRPLNKFMRGILNPHPQEVAQNDKVICLKNGEYKPARLMPDLAPDMSEARGENGIKCANGEIGYVERHTASHVCVRLEAPERLIDVPISLFTGESPAFDHAYAVTGHKMQGSQAKVIIIMADGAFGAGMVCNREWWYTSISRAEKLCIVVGDRAIMDKQCQRSVLLKRRTMLARRIAELAT